MSGRDETAVREYVERMALTLSDLGFPRMPARVLMTFMASDDDALTAAELAARLGASPAAISGAVRYLMQVSMLRRHPMPGSRQHAYSLYEDTWFHASAKGGIYQMLAVLAKDGVDAAGADTPAGRRIAEMGDFFAFLGTEMAALVDRWHAERDARAQPPDEA